ncbi:MAG: class I SAM-dependent methyltransferase [Thermoanaerobaculia bacterium]
MRFPVIDGVPILLDEQASIFTFSDFVEKRKTYFDPNRRGHRLRDLFVRMLYENTTEGKTDELLSTFARHLRLPAPRILVVGAGAAGLASLSSRGIEVVSTDVSLGDDVAIVCDGHDLPFDDETFDGVIAQAVLEHVVDPVRCVEEMHRVLRPDGIVFSDTPFMQQVHGGRFDFTRFTHLGHRRLFRRFEELESGASAGPGIALIWSYRYFLLSFSTSLTLTRFLRVFAKATSFWWKYFDRFLIDRPGALDAASGLYFIGRKSESVLSDRALVASYRGVNQR